MWKDEAGSMNHEFSCFDPEVNSTKYKVYSIKDEVWAEVRSETKYGTGWGRVPMVNFAAGVWQELLTNNNDTVKYEVNNAKYKGNSMKYEV